MAEEQEASTGWNSEVWLSSDDTVANLTELIEVKTFDWQDGELERADSTTLKTPNRRRTSTPGLQGEGTLEIVLNARRGSDTHIALKAAKAAGDERYIRLNYAELGVLTWTDDLIGYVTNVAEGEVSPESVMEMTVTVAINDVVASAAYVEPTP